jgi:drug/metabolite transporter (DMT)-like permease
MSLELASNNLISAQETLLTSNQPKKNEVSNIPKPIIVYILVISSAFFICLSFTLNKMASLLTAFDQLIIRYSFQFIIAFSICKYKNLSCFGKKSERKLLIIRGLFGISIALSTLFAFKLTHPSDCITIINASVILTAIVCRVFIKEKLTCIHIIAVLLTIFGIVCIFRPKFLFNNEIRALNNFSMNGTNVETVSNESKQKMYTIIGTVLSLGIAISFALSNLFMKLLSNAKVHYAIVSIYPSMLSMPFLVVISLVLFFTGNSYGNFDRLFFIHCFYSIIGGFFGAFGILFLSLSFNYEDASKIAIVKTIDVFFSFFLQFLLLGIKIDLLGIVGAGLILSGTFCVILFKLIEKNTKNMNKVLKFLTFKF